MPDRTFSGVVVRPATARDLQAMARWHCRHLRHGLFPLLGQRFVRHWHATFLGSPHGLALVAEETRTPDPVAVGFLVGSTDQVRHVDHVIRRHRLQLGLVGLLALAARPRLWRHFFQTRSRRYLQRLLGRSTSAPQGTTTGMGPRDEAGAASGQKPHVAVITAVVVEPSARGSGAGTALVSSFISMATAAGAPEAQLVTMAGPAGKGPFYRKLGWQQIDEHSTRDGAVMSTYRYSLRRRDPRSDPPVRPRSDGHAGRHRGRR